MFLAEGAGVLVAVAGALGKLGDRPTPGGDRGEGGEVEVAGTAAGQGRGAQAEAVAVEDAGAAIEERGDGGVGAAVGDGVAQRLVGEGAGASGHAEVLRGWGGEPARGRAKAQTWDQAVMVPLTRVTVLRTVGEPPEEEAA